MSTQLISSCDNVKHDHESLLEQIGFSSLNFSLARELSPFLLHEYVLSLLVSKLFILSLHSLNKFHVSCFIFSHLNNLPPASLSLLPYLTSSRSTCINCLSGINLLLVLKPRLLYLEGYFIYNFSLAFFFSLGYSTNFYTAEAHPLTFLFQNAFLWFYVLFNLVFSRFYAVFSRFYSFSVNIIVLFFLVGSCTFCMYTLCTYYHYYYYHFYFILFLFFNIFIFKRWWK